MFLAQRIIILLFGYVVICMRIKFTDRFLCSLMPACLFCVWPLRHVRPPPFLPLFFHLYLLPVSFPPGYLPLRLLLSSSSSSIPLPFFFSPESWTDFPADSLWIVAFSFNCRRRTPKHTHKHRQSLSCTPEIPPPLFLHLCCVYPFIELFQSINCTHGLVRCLLTWNHATEIKKDASSCIT